MAREGEKGQVKLLVATLSPFVVRVRIALALKGIDYEIIQEDLKNKSELLLQSNPVYKQIPVFIHNGKHVCQSLIIVQYIEEAWNNKASNLMPKDPYDRAIARFWAAFIDDKLQKAVEDNVTNLLLIEEALRTNRCFAGKAYFGGDEIDLIDIALGGMSTYIRALEKATNTILIDPKKMSLLTAWMDRFGKSEGLKEVMPDPAKHAAYLSAWRAKVISPPTAN
eukprot:PITA_14583